MPYQTKRYQKRPIWQLKSFLEWTSVVPCLVSRSTQPGHESRTQGSKRRLEECSVGVGFTDPHCTANIIRVRSGSGDIVKLNTSWSLWHTPSQVYRKWTSHVITAVFHRAVGKLVKETFIAQLTFLFIWQWYANSRQRSLLAASLISFMSTKRIFRNRYWLRAHGAFMIHQPHLISQGTLTKLWL